MRQTYWDCKNTADDIKRKTYNLKNKPRLKTTRTIVRDCAVSVSEEKLQDLDQRSDLVTEDEIEGEDLTKVSDLRVGDLRKIFKAELLAWSTGKK